MRWWRIEVNATGKVVSCRAVESAGDDDAHVIYVLARDQREAGRHAWNEYCRIRQTKRNARLAAEGKCRCGRHADRGAGKRCSGCLQLLQRQNERRRARARGEQLPKVDPRATKQERREADETALRLAILMEVLSAWQDAQTNASFTRWLTAQIARLRGKAAA